MSDLQLQAHLAEYTRTYQQQCEFIKLSYQLSALAAVIFAAGVTFLTAADSRSQPQVLYVPLAMHAVVLLQVYLDTQLHMQARYMEFELRPRIAAIVRTHDFWLLPSYHRTYGGPARPFFRVWGRLVLVIPLLLAAILLAIYWGLPTLGPEAGRYWLFRLNCALVVAVSFISEAVIRLNRHLWGNERLRRERYEAVRDYHKTQQSLRGFDLSRQDLSAAQLRRADLREANLQQANLHGAVLVSAQLQRADLRQANLQQATLTGANLQGARMQSADLRGTNLTRANLQWARLEGAKLQEACLCGADLQGAHLWRAQLAAARLSQSTLMPQGWEDSVASQPREDETEVQSTTRMKRSTTVTGKPFYYEGDVSHALTVHPTDKEGLHRSGGKVLIPAHGIDFIRAEIRKARIIPMGACRDNPSSGSLGDRLRERGKSPQWLSYVIPLLAEEGFCEFFKEGRRYMVHITGYP